MQSRETIEHFNTQTVQKEETGVVQKENRGWCVGALEIKANDGRGQLKRGGDLCAVHFC